MHGDLARFQVRPTVIQSPPRRWELLFSTKYLSNIFKISSELEFLEIKSVAPTTLALNRSIKPSLPVKIIIGRFLKLGIIPG